METLCSVNRRNQVADPAVDERKIAFGIFYLFEYLPHASQYIDLIIKLNNKIDNTIVQLSGMNCMNYLMRKPLLRIVNCYASSSVELFLTNLKEYTKVFLYVLVKPGCLFPINMNRKLIVHTLSEKDSWEKHKAFWKELWIHKLM